MKRRELLGKCPVCGESLDVTRLACRSCGTAIEGRFDTCKFCRLTPEHRAFVDVFIKSRGNIKEVEKELGISYPTVRNRLDAVIAALGYRVDEPATEKGDAGPERKAIVEALARGEISADDAVKRLRTK